MIVLVLARSGIVTSISLRDTGSMKWDSVSRMPHHREANESVKAVEKGWKTLSFRTFNILKSPRKVQHVTDEV